jgi:hypothetical protein
MITSRLSYSITERSAPLIGCGLTKGLDMVGPGDQGASAYDEANVTGTASEVGRTHGGGADAQAADKIHRVEPGIPSARR